MYCARKLSLENYSILTPTSLYIILHTCKLIILIIHSLLLQEYLKVYKFLLFICSNNIDAHKLKALIILFFFYLILILHIKYNLSQRRYGITWGIRLENISPKTNSSNPSRHKSFCFLN